MNTNFEPSIRLLSIFKYIDERYVYIRIPKTGSQSMNNALWNVSKSAHLQRKLDNINAFLDPPAGWWDHLSARFCRKVIGKDVWDSTNTFSIVRNPYARLYSLWKYAPKINQNTSFKEWILTGCIYPGWMTNGKQKIVMPENPVLSQNNWITDENKNLLVAITFRLEEIDNNAIQELLKEITGDRSFQMPPLMYNKTSEPEEYKDHYDQEMIDWVNSYCAEDLQIFQYDFDGILPGSENFVLVRE